MKDMKIDKTNYTLLKQNVLNLYRARRELVRVKKETDEIIKQETVNIKNFMFCNMGEASDFNMVLDMGDELYREPIEVKVSKVTPKKIDWDVKGLKKVLSKDQASRVLQKKYEVVDMPGLIEYLKSCGVNPSEFKKHIVVNESVNVTELNNIYETGEADINELKKCCSVTEGTSYIKITEHKM